MAPTWAEIEHARHGERCFKLIRDAGLDADQFAKQPCAPSFKIVYVQTGDYFGFGSKKRGAHWRRPGFPKERPQISEGTEQSWEEKMGYFQQWLGDLRALLREAAKIQKTPSQPRVTEDLIALRKALYEVWRSLPDNPPHWIDLAPAFFGPFQEYAKGLFRRDFTKLKDAPLDFVLGRINGFDSEGKSTGPCLKSRAVYQIAPEIYEFLQAQPGHPDHPEQIDNDNLLRLIDIRMVTSIDLKPDSKSPLPQRIRDAAHQAGFPVNQHLRARLAALPGTLWGDWAEEMDHTMPGSGRHNQQLRFLPLAMMHDATRNRFVGETFYLLKGLADELFSRRQLQVLEDAQPIVGVEFWRRYRAEFAAVHPQAGDRVSVTWHSGSRVYSFVGGSAEIRRTFQSLAGIAITGLKRRDGPGSWTDWLDVLRITGHNCRVASEGTGTIRRNSPHPSTREAEKAAPADSVVDGDYIRSGTISVEIDDVFDASANLCLELESRVHQDSALEVKGSSGAPDLADEKEAVTNEERSETDPSVTQTEPSGAKASPSTAHDFSTVESRTAAIEAYQKHWRNNVQDCSEASLARSANVDPADLSKWKRLALPEGSSKGDRIERVLRENSPPKPLAPDRRRS